MRTSWARCSAVGFILLTAFELGASAGPAPLPPARWLEPARAERCATGDSRAREPWAVRPPVSRAEAFAARERREAAPPPPGSAPCSPAEYAALGGGAFVEAIATSTDGCLGTLWSFDGDVAAAIAGPNLVAVASAMTVEASNLLVHAPRLRQMALFYQIAFFHEFYQPGIDYDATTVDAVQSAVVAVSASPDFFDESAPVVSLREQWTVTLDSVNATHLVVDVVQAILERYHADPALALVHVERVTAWHCLFSLQRQVWNGTLLGAASPWLGLLDLAFVDAVSAIALDTGYPAAAEYVVLNALYTLGVFSFLDPPIHDAAHEDLSAAYALFTPYGAAWLRAVLDLETFYGAELYDGTPLDMQQIRDDVTEIALPHTYAFDQGRTVYRTAIKIEAAADLYDAIQEVESQFFRKTTFLHPVPGDPNEVITLVIYASPDDYQTYQPFLYGLPTDNGGIYIEGDGRLYTYDRTPQQSIFTLEELLRHEFVHYLDSRFVVVPSFGDPGSLYDGSRLVWYTEGLAEFLVGSTRTEGVLTRTNLLQQIEDDVTRMTVAQILDVTYGSGFGFYPYAGMLFRFLSAEHPSLLAGLFDVVRGDDAPAVDAFFATLASDAVLQQDFDAYLTAQIAAMNTGGGPFAEDVPTTLTPDGLREGNAAEVLATLAATLPSAAGDFRVWPARYRYRDVIALPFVAPPGATSSAARAAFETEIDGYLDDLSPLSRNFASAVAWFGDLEIVGDLAWAAIAVEGPFLPATADATAPAAPTGLGAVAGAGAIVLRWDENDELDLAGYHVYRSTVDGGPYQRIDVVPVPAPQYADHEPAAGTTAYYRVTAVDATGNESAFSGQAQASSAVRVLLVDGYFWTPSYYADAYADALDALGVPHGTWDHVAQGEVPASVLLDYVDGLVVWAVGYLNEPSQMSPAQQAAIHAYLDAGGSLLLSGAYLANGLGSTALFTDYLHCSLVGFNINLPGLDGVPGSVLGDGLSLTMNYVGYESEFDLAPPATASFVYDPGSGPGGIDSSGTAIFTVDGPYKVAFLAFPFADVEQQGGLQLLQRILDWTLPGVSAPPDLRFAGDKETLFWEPLGGAQSYDVYRGGITDLVDGDADGLPDGGYGECRNFADHSVDTVHDTFFTDPQAPLPGGGSFYLVGYRRAGVDQGIGTTSGGLTRVPGSVCP